MNLTYELHLIRRSLRVLRIITALESQVGDQVYGDEDFAGLMPYQKDEMEARRKTGCWGQAMFIATAPGIDRSNREQCRARICGLYKEVYWKTWNHPATAYTLASTSNLTILDDHDTTDDCGAC